MVKILRNDWKLIVTTILCIYWCSDVGEANSKMWHIVRRFLEVNDSQDTGSTRLSFRSAQEPNRSSTADEEFNRARFRQHMSTESRGGYQPSANTPTLRSQPKQYTKEGEKPKHRFLIEKHPAASKHHSYKSLNLIHQNNVTQYNTEARNTPDLVITTKSEEPKNKIKTESKQNQIEERAEKPHIEKGIGKKGNERIQSDKSKMSVRALRYRDSGENARLKKNRFRQSNSVGITKMYPAYELQEDDETLAHTKHTNFQSDRLNPYAINEQMMRFMEKQKDEMNITMEVIGRTTEYNNILLLKITEIQKEPSNYFRVHKYADEAPEKKIIFIVHGLAVRGMGVLMDSEAKFATLMSFYASYLKYFDIFVIPIANPDGFTAVLNSHHGSFWNKNMSPQSSCYGVMLDRNFDVEWNASHGISPCSHVYPGPTPFSEPETRAVRDVLHLYSQKIVAYIHVHASAYDASIFKGDAVLYPRGYTTSLTDDDKYIDIKGDLEESLKNATFKIISVAVEPLHSWYGIVTGTSVDFASSVYGIPYAMEFCMQIFENMQDEALNQIWRRVVDVVFQSIWKNSNNKNND